tara:strand:- start:297 stop:503 length:207 start_codon:yes stop_codon:yes gene_type:complete
MVIEKLDVKNIFEIERIRNILNKEDEDLNIFFEMLIVIVNSKLNNEDAVSDMEIEDYVEPSLSSDDDE